MSTYLITLLSLLSYLGISFGDSSFPKYVLSSSSSTYSMTGITRAQPTNLSVSFKTNGKPVEIMLVQDGGSTAADIHCQDGSATGSYGGVIYLMRDSTDISTVICGGYSSAFSEFAYIMPSAIGTIDIPAAGTYTYKVQVRSSSTTGTVDVQRTKLLVIQR